MAPRPITIIVNDETVLASWLRDFGSLGSLAALIYVNHIYGAGNGWVDTLGVALVVAWLGLGLSKRKGAIVEITSEELRDLALSGKLDGNAPQSRFV